MITIFIKHLFIYFFSVFVFNKSLSIPRLSTAKNLILSVILSLLTCLVSLKLEGLSYSIPLFFFGYY